MLLPSEGHMENAGSKSLVMTDPSAGQVTTPVPIAKARGAWSRGQVDRRRRMPRTSGGGPHTMPPASRRKRLERSQTYA